MDFLANSLYSISMLLLGPVMALLLLLLIACLILLGGFLREWAGRRRLRRALTAAIHEAPAPASLWSRLAAISSGLPGRLASTTGGHIPSDRPSLDHALGDLESTARGRLALLSFFTRVAPMLGLMGTLIPLGPALTGLASGDMQKLSSNLVIAFTTTIAGLFVSGLAYTMGLARRIWYDRDLSDLELLASRMIP